MKKVLFTGVLLIVVLVSFATSIKEGKKVEIEEVQFNCDVYCVGWADEKTDGVRNNNFAIYYNGCVKKNRDAGNCSDQNANPDSHTNKLTETAQ
ncbi:MAG: hypothetical protein ACPG45_03435 [Flavobacteriaceae bacterium]